MPLGLKARFALKEIENGEVQKTYRGSHNVTDGILRLESDEAKFVFEYEHEKKGELEELTLIAMEPEDLRGVKWSFKRDS